MLLANAIIPNIQASVLVVSPERNQVIMIVKEGLVKENYQVSLTPKPFRYPKAQAVWLFFSPVPAIQAHIQVSAY